MNVAEAKITAPSLASLEGCSSCHFHISVSANFLQGIDESIFIHQPLVYCHFAQGVGEPRYHQVRPQSYTHKFFRAIPSCRPCCSFQASIYSLLAVVIKSVSLIVFDLNQFSLWIFSSSHIQRPHGINSAVMSHLSEYK